MNEISEVVYDAARAEMVRRQLVGRDIRDSRVLEAMGSVRRHAFVGREQRHLAYKDGPLEIGANQTISQPYIVALMCQVLALKGNENVLEIGTGSGYQAAVLSRLARFVTTIEIIPDLAEQADGRLQKAGYQNVRVIQADGSMGWPDSAPYDAIVLAAAAPRVSREILAQLADGGRLVLPVGGRQGQQLQIILRRGDRFQRKKLVPVAFVPLRGEAGWTEKHWK